MFSHMRPRFDNEDTNEIERCITALDALAANTTVVGPFDTAEQLIAALDAPEPVRERGPWNVYIKDARAIGVLSEDFHHDALLRVSGDFAGRCNAACARRQSRHGHLGPSRTQRALGADAAPEPAAPPDTSQEWAKLDGATAFLLIDRHAEDWAHTGRMMDAWRAARAEREVRETCQWASHLMSSHMRPRFDNEDTAEIERCITALDALAANKPQEPAPVASARLRATVRARPLNGTLDDYWRRPAARARTHTRGATSPTGCFTT
jgi:hypothetical protein